MRGIKFRVWDEKQKIFHYWGFINGAFTHPPNGLSMEYIEKNSEKFIHHKDKNSEEIYGGDIIQGEYKDDIFESVITWDKDTVAFGIIDTMHYNGPIAHDIIFDTVDNWGTTIDEFNIKIIGNIHENPELLEEVR